MIIGNETSSPSELGSVSIYQLVQAATPLALGTNILIPGTNTGNTIKIVTSVIILEQVVDLVSYNIVAIIDQSKLVTFRVDGTTSPTYIHQV
jgi:hypothetical protein